MVRIAKNSALAFDCTLASNACPIPGIECATQPCINLAAVSGALMSSYDVKGVAGLSTVVVIASTDTATAALIKYRDAITQYRRVWVTDETGFDIGVVELLARFEAESRGG